MKFVVIEAKEKWKQKSTVYIVVPVPGLQEH